MAGMKRNATGYYIARTHLPKGSHPTEVGTALRTRDYKTALTRKIEVEKRAEEIKAGLNVSFPWMNEDQELKIVHFSLEDARRKYIKARKVDRLSKGTMDIMENALKHFQRILKPSFPIETIGIRHIDQFKEKCHEKGPKYAEENGYSNTTINIWLRNIKTFLLWLEERDMIPTCPKIKMLPTIDQIRYLSNDQFEKILEKLDPFMQRGVHFYRETGNRLSEPFYGIITGDFLTITAEHAKGRKARDIFLTSYLKEILIDLRENTHLTPDGNMDPSVLKLVRKTHEIKYYSKMFKKAAIACGFDKVRFHDLRHTAALRTYLKTRDIYLVARLLGHSNISTTMIYTKFNLKRLEQDFPDLVKSETPDEVQLSVAS